MKTSRSDQPAQIPDSGKIQPVLSTNSPAGSSKIPGDGFCSLKYPWESDYRFMVGWGFAFGRGFVILLWSIVWAIIAGIIAVLITGGTLAGVIRDPTAVASNPFGFLAAFFLGIFLSVLIAIIGLYASIVKVAVDGALSQLEKSGQYSKGSYSTGSQSMGSQPTLVAPAMRKFCANCGNALQGGTMKCSNCGASL